MDQIHYEIKPYNMRNTLTLIFETFACSVRQIRREMGGERENVDSPKTHGP